MLLVETIFDTLNAKAALGRDRGRLRGARGAPARHDLGDHHRQERAHPLGADGRGVLDLVAHARPLSVGRQLRPRRREMRPTSRSCRASPTCSSAATRTPACPTRSASTTRPGARPRPLVRGLVDEGLVNIVGGCCGTTPDHIRAIATRVGALAARAARAPRAYSRFAGLEPLVLRPVRTSSMIGERTNVTGSKRFADLVKNGDYAKAVEVALDQVAGAPTSST